MPDITLCSNHAEGCKQAETCYRATAKPGERQSYAPLYLGRVKCAYYMRGWHAAANEIDLPEVEK